MELATPAVIEHEAGLSAGPAAPGLNRHQILGQYDLPFQLEPPLVGAFRKVNGAAIAPIIFIGGSGSGQGLGKGRVGGGDLFAIIAEGQFRFTGGAENQTVPAGDLQVSIGPGQFGPVMKVIHMPGDTAAVTLRGEGSFVAVRGVKIAHGHLLLNAGVGEVQGNGQAFSSCDLHGQGMLLRVDTAGDGNGLAAKRKEGVQLAAPQMAFPPGVFDFLFA